MPALDVYQSQKNIQVVSNADPLCFGKENPQPACQASMTASQAKFFGLRIEMALGLATEARPSYFPGAVIPGPGGASCSEVERGNLLFDQFKFVLAFDPEMQARISGPQHAGHSGQGSQTSQSAQAGRPDQSKLFCREEAGGEPWLWQYIEAPRLYFLYQATAPVEESADRNINSALAVFADAAQTNYNSAAAEDFSAAVTAKLLAFISDAWFRPSSGMAPVSWGEQSIERAAQALRQYQPHVKASNLLPFLFEVEAMASHVSLAEESSVRESFARGVFAGNFIDVSMAPVVNIKATEFCVRERLFDEVINLSSRGFAPVVINEYGLVADGNHRLTASFVWNILKFTQDLDWSLENDEFQKRVAQFTGAVLNGLLKYPAQLSPVTMHQALNHLAYFLCRPDWRARLNSYTKPLLKRHDFIFELPVVVLPEYLSGAVVKSLYDEGQTVQRACPSIYEAMSLNNHLVLPPRASYHFTDAALLPWFTVLKTSCGTKRRTPPYGPRAGTGRSSLRSRRRQG